MVHDPRVTEALARLGGLYRDPSRVNRDVSILLKSSVGAHLRPGIAPLVENNGESCTCLVLQGTIGICFRGTTYQLLIDLFCAQGYPMRPPVVYVRLGGPNMYLKENHLHVGSDGKIYLPYLHEWKSSTHNLVELIVAISSIFSADPPVFTRPTPPPPPPPQQQQQQQQYHQQQQLSSSSPGTELLTPPPLPSSMMNGISNNNTIAQEIEEANRVAEIARLAEQKEIEEEEQKNKLAKAQVEWENKKKLGTKDEVIQKLKVHLTEFVQQTNQQIKGDQKDEKRLQLSTDEKLIKQYDTLSTMKDKYTKTLTIINNKTNDIEQWLSEVEENKSMDTSSDENSKAANNINNMVQPKYPLYEQMLQLAAEDASLTDVLYFIDQGLVRGVLDCKTHIKQVRKIAKRQFLVKAHLLKIQHALKEVTSI